MRVARPADGVLAMKSKSFLVNARRCALERGFSLVELMVTVAVLSLLMTLAVPSFNEWIQNGRIRTAAESIQNGLQVAVDHRAGHADPEQALLALGHVAGHPGRMLDLLEDQPRLHQEGRARLGQLAAIGIAHQQGHAQILLQVLDGDAQRRLSDRELVRRAAEVTLLGHHDEVAKQMGFHNHVRAGQS